MRAAPSRSPFRAVSNALALAAIVEGPSDRPSGSPKRARISSASGAVGTP